MKTKLFEKSILENSDLSKIRGGSGDEYVYIDLDTGIVYNSEEEAIAAGAKHIGGMLKSVAKKALPTCGGAV